MTEVTGWDGFVGYSADVLFSMNRDSSTGQLFLELEWEYGPIEGSAELLAYCKKDECQPVSRRVYGNGEPAEVCVAFTDVFLSPADLRRGDLSRKAAHTECFSTKAWLLTQQVPLEAWDVSPSAESSQYLVWIKAGPAQVSDAEAGDEISYRPRAMGGFDLGLGLGLARWSMYTSSLFALQVDAFAHVGVRLAKWFALVLSVGYQNAQYQHGAALLGGVELRPTMPLAISVAFGPSVGSETERPSSDFTPAVGLSAVVGRASISGIVSEFGREDGSGFRLGGFIKVVHSWAFEQRWTFFGGLELGLGG